MCPRNRAWAVVGRRQAFTWSNDGIVLIRTSGTNVGDIINEMKAFMFNKIHLNMWSAKWRPFCLGLHILRVIFQNTLRLTDCHVVLHMKEDIGGYSKWGYLLLSTWLAGILFYYRLGNNLLPQVALQLRHRPMIPVSRDHFLWDTQPCF